MKWEDWASILVCGSCIYWGLLIGFMLWYEKVCFWRIEWIKLEYDLARLENRTPRNIDVFYKDEIKMKKGMKE